MLRSNQPLMTLWIAAAICLVIAGVAESRGFRTELVRVKTTDGEVLTGALREPANKSNKACIVMLHGYGGNFYSGLMSFLPEALADRGITTFTVNMRDHDLGPKRNLFEDNRSDIAAAVDEINRRGYGPIYLFGHSMGTNRVLYYLAETSDRRIKGVLLSAPPGNLFEWNVKIFGKKAALEVLDKAERKMAEGKGDEVMLIDLGPLGKALYSARHVISLRGPASCSDPFKNIARVKQPIMIVHGLEDKLADPGVDERLRSCSANPKMVTIAKIARADHRFHLCEEILANTIAEWLGKETGNR